MKTKATLMMLWFFYMLTLNALSQAPQGFNYQAVVRDDAGNIVGDQIVGIKISIMQGSVDGTVVYSETHSPTTNSFGLVTLEIGDGTVTFGNFTTIDWGSSTYFLKVELDATGGTTYTEMGTSQILSVPYALHSKKAENVFSGDYLDLLNTPTNVSSFSNDVGYLTSFTESDPVFGIHVSADYITDGNTGWDNSYGFITASSKETLTYKSGNISMWTNDAGYLRKYTETDPIFEAHVANKITLTNIKNWNTAFDWGDHSTLGYFSAGGEAGGTNRTLGNTDNFSLGFKTNDATRLFIANDGKVGIGNTSPNLDLSVGTGGDNRFGLQRGDAGSNAGYLRFGDNTGWKFHIGRASETSGGIINTDDTGALVTVQDKGNVGIGTTSPSVKLDVNGDVRITGNLQVDGNIGIETIDVSQITGLLGEGFTLNFPDILDNLVTLDIGGILTTEKIVMLSGMGQEIERIYGFLGDNPFDQPGLSMEYPIIFETTSQQDADEIINWYESHPGEKPAGSIVIKDIAGIETSRWNFFEYIMTVHEPGVDGRTRFTLVHTLIPDNVLHCVWEGVNGSEWSYNPATDKLVEISGESHSNFNPQVELDEVNRTITLTYDYNEGFGLYNWVKETIQGTGNKRSGSIIETTNGDTSTEIMRNNYFGIFPIKFEQFYGFGMNTKLKTRIVLSYDYWDVGK